MRDTHRLITFGVALTCTAAITQAGTFALGFGGGISYSSTHTETIPGSGVFDIGVDDTFYFEPGAGGWEKTLLPPSQGFIPGQIYCVNEWFTFCEPPTGEPGRPLEDWHEEIALGSDGLPWDIWVTDFGPPIISFDPDLRDPIPGLEFMISADGTNLWFDFDPIFPGPDGITLHIQKYFRYTGPTVSFAPVVITQYPTPAPSSLALLGIAGLVTCRRRR
jgi:hypothetical protein